jgi:hypothetical protein
MSRSFVQIVRNYEKVLRIGSEIIRHKEVVSNLPPERLDAEFKNQEDLIESFFINSDLAHKEWCKNKDSVNEYWTGLS